MSRAGEASQEVVVTVPPHLLPALISTTSRVHHGYTEGRVLAYRTRTRRTRTRMGYTLIPTRKLGGIL